MNEKEIVVMNTKGMSSIAEPSDSDLGLPHLDWAAIEKLAAELPDDDPRCNLTGYDQYDQEEWISSIVRAKGMIAARDNLAQAASMIANLFCKE